MTKWKNYINDDYELDIYESESYILEVEHSSSDKEYFNLRAKLIRSKKDKDLKLGDWKHDVPFRFNVVINLKFEGTIEEAKEYIIYEFDIYVERLDREITDNKKGEE